MRAGWTTPHRAPPAPPPAVPEAIATTRAPPGATRFVPVLRLGAIVVAELASDEASRGGEMVYVARCVDDDEEGEEGDRRWSSSSSARRGLEALRCAATARGVWLEAATAAAVAGRASGTRERRGSIGVSREGRPVVHVFYIDDVRYVGQRAASGARARPRTRATAPAMSASAAKKPLGESKDGYVEPSTPLK